MDNVVKGLTENVKLTFSIDTETQHIKCCPVSIIIRSIEVISKDLISINYEGKIPDFGLSELDFLDELFL